METAVIVISIVGAALKALEPAFPGVVKALTGGQTADEAIASAQAAAKAIPDRTAQGDADLEARKARG